LVAEGARAVLVKVGHLNTPRLTDTLVDPSGERWQRSAPRLITRNLHGSGCSLSSAIAAHLALGHGLNAAVQAAHAYIRGAIQAGANVTTGHGHGPLNHGFAPVAMVMAKT
jgi:hydroxymethylpyrimidine/phosphomethylpyrimidine kinase